MDDVRANEPRSTGDGDNHGLNGVSMNVADSRVGRLAVNFVILLAESTLYAYYLLACLLE